jgi:hypothetical protein
VVSFVIVVALWLGVDGGDVAAEARLGAMAEAWWAARISMPATTALSEPRVVKAPPHREAEVITAALLAQRAAPTSAPPPPRVYPEAVLLQALRRSDRAFGRCWSRAREAALATPRKARLHLEVDSTGVVRAARTAELDGEAQSDRGEISGCIARAGLRLPLPALGRPVKLSLLLLH